MISRVWTATATSGGASEYARHFNAHVLPSLASVDGYRGALLFERPTPDAVELVVISFWTSEDAIRRFAGANIEQAVVADEARQLLRSFDDTVRHYSVAAQDAITLG
jgi:heme-degrading monooxygenase HmoA